MDGATDLVQQGFPTGIELTAVVLRLLGQGIRQAPGARPAPEDCEVSEAKNATPTAESDIGLKLDSPNRNFYKLLILLALPRGIEPLFQP